MLEALGVGAVPAGLDAQTALYRSLIAGKRMLIVIDDARDTAVTPLLPGSPTCTVLVTSRNQLTGLVSTHGARPVALGLLGEPEARALLVQRLGQSRVDAEPAAVAEIQRRCAGLPLALSIVAAHAATAADLPLAVFATELDALDTGDLPASLRAVFGASYRALDADCARAFRLLGLAPGPDISRPAAAALIGRADTQALLRRLTTANLVQQHEPGRYRMHDLPRLYAAELARVEDPRGPHPAVRLLPARRVGRDGSLLPQRGLPQARATPADLPAHGHALYWRARILDRLGFYAEALDHHQRALRIAKAHRDHVLECYAEVGMHSFMSASGMTPRPSSITPVRSRSPGAAMTVLARRSS